MTPLRTPGTPLPAELESLIRAQLQHAERITCSAQPIPARVARRLLPGFPVSIVLLVASPIGWSKFAAATLFREPVLTMLQIIYFAAVLIFAVACGIPYFWLRRSARRVAYVATDRRFLMVRSGGWRGTSIQSYEPRQLAKIELVQNADGSGDLVLERREVSNPEGLNTMEAVGFLAIPNVAEAFARIRDLVNKASTNTLDSTADSSDPQ